MSADLEYATFLHAWAPKIDAWARRALSQQGSSTDLDDLRQVAQLAAWMGYMEWRALPDQERDEPILEAIVGRKVKDAILDERARVLQRPRKAQRGSGARAELMRGYLATLVHTSRTAFVRGRADVIARCVTAYHLEMAGMLHSQTGLVDAERALLRDEVRDRLNYAFERIGEQGRAIIEGVFFQGRTLADVCDELRIFGRTTRSRLKAKALDDMRKYMEEFASSLGPHNTGGTLDDEPGAGGSIA